MSIKEQSDFYKSLYDDEVNRLGRLTGRASLYFTIISFFLGAIIFKFDDITKFLFLFHVPMVFYLLVADLLGLSLIFTLIAICIRPFERICDPEEVANQALDDEAFWEARIADYSISTNRNVIHGNRIACLLRLASVLMVCAAIIQVGVLITATAIKLVSTYTVAHLRKTEHGDMRKKNTNNNNADRKKAGPNNAAQAQADRQKRMADLLKQRRDQKITRDEASNQDAGLSE